LFFLFVSQICLPCSSLANNKYFTLTKKNCIPPPLPPLVFF
jgi:hypothetical protein